MPAKAASKCQIASFARLALGAMPNMAQPAGEWVRAQDIQQDIDFACTSCRYVYHLDQGNYREDDEES